jgi:acetyl esterase
VIAYYHGGGWVLGSIDEFDAFGRHLAARSGYTVVLVDYRLAPEHRFPAAVEDASDALQWVADHLSELAGPQAPLIVAGDSAGGNLAAVVAQRARGGDIPIALQLLIYPVVDCDLERPSYVDPGNQLFLDRAGMEWFWSHYIPDPAKRADPAASPLRAADLSGLPPAVVLTAEHDPLRDEGEEYARRLADAGVPVELRRFDRQMHAFCMFVGVLASSLEAIDWLTAAAGRALPTAPA